MIKKRDFKVIYVAIRVIFIGVKLKRKKIVPISFSGYWFLEIGFIGRKDSTAWFLYIEFSRNAISIMVKTHYVRNLLVLRVRGY